MQLHWINGFLGYIQRSPVICQMVDCVRQGSYIIIMCNATNIFCNKLCKMVDRIMDLESFNFAKFICFNILKKWSHANSELKVVDYPLMLEDKLGKCCFFKSTFTYNSIDWCILRMWNITSQKVYEFICISFSSINFWVSDEWRCLTPFSYCISPGKHLHLSKVKVSTSFSSYLSVVFFHFLSNFAAKSNIFGMNRR